MYRTPKTPRASKQIAGIVDYCIDNGETLQTTLQLLFDILEPSDPRTLRKRVIEAYCANENPKKATKVNDPSQCRMVMKQNYMLVVGGGDE